jgi:FkbM family methyltransferase
MYVPRKLAQFGIGGYEPEALACFLAVLDQAPPGPVWDVGANVGIYGLVARAATDREVIAFEPTPDLAKVARTAAADSGLPYRVMEIALADQMGEMTLYLSDITDSSNSLNAGFRKSSEQIMVTVDTADHLVETHELRPPAALKIDTETSEPEVIRGALNLIRERRPWILCEVLAGATPDRLNDVLSGLDYAYYHITGELPYERKPQIHGDPKHKHLMWLFAPQPVNDEFFDRIRLWSAELQRCAAPAAKAT